MRWPGGGAGVSAAGGEGAGGAAGDVNPEPPGAEGRLHLEDGEGAFLQEHLGGGAVQDIIKFQSTLTQSIL